jgi:hypothetical protein
LSSPRLVNSRRRITAIGVAVFLSIGAGGTAPAATGAPDPEHAACMGLGSSFYAHLATGQRALVARLVREEISPVPGQHYRIFAQEKEGGAIPAPCGARIE